MTRRQFSSSWDLVSVLAERGGTGGGRWVPTLGQVNVAASGLCFRKPLVGTGWATSFLLYGSGLA